jgi:hypothetical protein
MPVLTWFTIIKAIKKLRIPPEEISVPLEYEVEGLLIKTVPRYYISRS